MEVSPLPHKTPFSAHVQVTSPTPLSTPTVDEDDNDGCGGCDDDDDDDMMLDSPAPITRHGSLEPHKPLMAEFVPV